MGDIEVYKINNYVNKICVYIKNFFFYFHLKQKIIRFFIECYSSRFYYNLEILNL
jgi:hypothetical protein